MSRVKHVMVDLETLGLLHYSPVLSVGACVFDPYTDYIFPMNYYKVINHKQMHVDVNTLVFWLKQGNKLLELLTSVHAVAQTTIAPTFIDWLKTHHPSEAYRFWCHGLDFDLKIFKELFQSNYPDGERWDELFKYNDGRDTRTIFEAANFDYKAFPRYGEFHNALDDAITQAKAVQFCFKTLRDENAPPPTTAPRENNHE